MEIYIHNGLIKSKMTSEEMYDKYPVLNLEFKDYIKIGISLSKKGLDMLKETIKYIEMDNGSSYFYSIENQCEFFDNCEKKTYKIRKDNIIRIKPHCYNIKSMNNVFCPIREKILKKLRKDDSDIPVGRLLKDSFVKIEEFKEDYENYECLLNFFLKGESKPPDLQLEQWYKEFLERKELLFKSK